MPAGQRGLTAARLLGATGPTRRAPSSRGQLNPKHAHALLRPQLPHAYPSSAPASIRMLASRLSGKTAVAPSLPATAAQLLWWARRAAPRLDWPILRQLGRLGLASRSCEVRGANQVESEFAASGKARPKPMLCWRVQSERADQLGQQDTIGALQCAWSEDPRPRAPSFDAHLGGPSALAEPLHCCINSRQPGKRYLMQCRLRGRLESDLAAASCRCQRQIFRRESMRKPLL